MLRALIVNSKLKLGSERRYAGDRRGMLAPKGFRAELSQDCVCVHPWTMIDVVCAAGPATGREG